MNNNFMRQGNNQNNRNRNRNRSRQRTTGGGGNNGGGGNSSNKVFDSNGPDVKLRGTAQTVAEKYMQLGRDAQSSGDSVSAESYYQHAEHYYRVWASSQPVGSSLIMSRKLGEDEFEEDGDGSEDDSAVPPATEVTGPEGAEVPAGDGQQPNQDGQQRPFNNNRNSNPNNNASNNGRERFKPRWQQRRDRWQDQPEGSPDQAQPAQSVDPQAEPARPADDNGQWEAPSFLQRPTPVVADEPEVATDAPRRGRPRRERPEPAVPADDDTPQGE